MTVRTAALALSILAISLSGAGTVLAQDTKEKAAAVKEEDGKWFDADGNPTFKMDEDGTVDWYTFSGYRRYHSDCHVCHGPDGVGSSYAPALAELVEELGLRHVPVDRCGRPPECRRRQGERHAGLR